MLILTRRLGETITVGENIKVTVVKVNGGQISLGIEAPKDVVVDRQEIHERRKREQRNPG